MDFTFFEQDLFGNSLKEFAICIGLLVIGFLLKQFCAGLISRQFFRIIKGFTGNQFSEKFVALERKPLEQFITLLILYFAFDRLKFPESWNLVAVDKIGLRWLISTIYQMALFVVITKILLRATDYFTYFLQNREDSPLSKELANFLKELLKVVIVILCVFATLRFVFSVNITALVASLGIGGLAVALAAQDTLTNLLASFIIYLDKPFKVGDTIENTEISGTIEHVGFRTTRIRTVDKTLLTVPNKKMIDSAMNNITESDIKRVKITLTLTYNSKPAQLLSIIEDIKKAIMNHPQTTENFVVNFIDLEASSLNILVVYFVNGNEYENMLKVKEDLNFKFMEIVEQHGCAFAFPSQTVYLNK